MTTRAVIRSTGSYLPERIMTNAEMEKFVDTSDEWIFQRSGIKSRRIAAQGELTSDMATKAAEKALAGAGVKPQDIDLVVVATTTPDYTFPSVAVKVQANLGIGRCPAFDVQAVCSGFIYALSVVNGMIASGQTKRALVIGAEKISSILDWEDRTTCVLFGDGAAGVVLEADNSAAGDVNDRGVLSTHLYADGSYQEMLQTTGGPASTQTTGTITMQGKEVFKCAVEFMAGAVEDALQENGLKAEEIDWLVPHQANIRIIQATARKLGLPMEKVITTVEHHGNTSAASIPLALDQAVREGKVKPGQLLLMEAMGGGMTWGSALVRF